MSTFKELDAEDLDSWRSHPVTLTFLREVSRRGEEKRRELRNASVDATLDRIRGLAGAVGEAEWVQTLINTAGKPE